MHTNDVNKSNIRATRLLYVPVTKCYEIQPVSQKKACMSKKNVWFENSLLSYKTVIIGQIL